MDPDSSVQIVLFVVLILLSALFTAAQASLAGLNKYKLKNLATELNSKAVLVSRLLDNPGKLFNTILIADTLANISAVVLGTNFAIQHWGERWGIVWSIIILSLMVAILGELLPRTLAYHRPEKTIINLIRFIYVAMIMLYPLIAFLNMISRLLAGLLGAEQAPQENGLTEQEIISMVAAGQEGGVIHQDETSMIHGVFDFTDTVVRDVMVPRPDIVAVANDVPLTELVRVMKEEQFSRLPVYEDNIDNILGVVHVKDIMEALIEEKKSFQLLDYLRQPFFVPETKKVNDLFKAMQKEKSHMAIVLDEYGSTAGLVTLEDLIEEIMGDIQDEHDSEEPELLNVDANTVEISGSMRIEELNEKLGLELQCAEAETVGGLVFAELDRVPLEGDQVILGDLELTVLEMDGHRIEKIRLIQQEQELKPA